MAVSSCRWGHWCLALGVGFRAGGASEFGAAALVAALRTDVAGRSFVGAV